MGYPVLRYGTKFFIFVDMEMLTPRFWKDYELLDTGDGEKLERFGKFVLRRPEPQAVWSKSLGDTHWEKQAFAAFVQEGSASGRWEMHRKVPENWEINYRSPHLKLRFKLALTGFKHVGIFPEQAVNWEFIARKTREIHQPKVLNLFAYTGGATLAARAAGADVIHCDSIRQVVSWANTNMELSKLKDVRWLVEDAFKFVKREANRGRTYNGIILDPPAWGHGPKGEKWKLDDQINELIRLVSEILDPEKHFLVFNAYSLGYSPLILANLIRTHFPAHIADKTESGELFLQEASGKRLPAGIFARF